MKGRAWVWSLVALGVVLLSFAALVATALVWQLPEHMPTITVNGRELDFGGAHVGHWMAATVALLIAMFVVLLVVPLAVLLGIALPMLIVTLVAVALLSPVLLIAWWVWRSTRAKPVKEPLNKSPPCAFEPKTG